MLMYAQQRYTPRSPRTVSIGAAIAINGLLVAGLVTMVPDIMPKPPVTILEGVNIPIQPPPPEIEEKRIVEARAQTPKPYIPPTTNPASDGAVIDATDVFPAQPDTFTKVEDPGPVVAEPPTPVAALIGAAPDPRFARDFQPEYPGSELRLERDGRVSVRVLIGRDGRVKAVEQVSATSPAFLEATRRQALAKWRFKPAMRGGVAEESWKVMSVRFELKNR